MLKGRGVEPKLYLDSRAPITTPYDKMQNRLDENRNGHGTCGVGVGRTYQRQEDHYSLLVGDVLHDWVFMEKLERIKRYYGCKWNSEEFLIACQGLYDSQNVYIVDSILDPLSRYNTVIFEGSQGLLLDQNFGFFPHVTRGNLGLRNILEMGLDLEMSVFLVTRAYHTRHGAGPIPNEDIKHGILPNPFETNSPRGVQGKFRVSTLDLDVLAYSTQVDRDMSGLDKTLIVTCLDNMAELWASRNGGSRRYDSEEEFAESIGEYLEMSVAVSVDPLPGVRTRYKYG